MCGIFGFTTSNSASYSNDFLSNSLKELGILSVRRGKDSSGLCGLNLETGDVDIVKGPVTIIKLLDNPLVKNSIQNWTNKNSSYKFAFGHSRLVTNGTQLDHNNNQPIQLDEIICVHNGIIVNVDELWSEHTHLSRDFEIDTEILLALIKANLDKGNSIEYSVKESFAKIDGTASVAILLNDFQKLILATNNGSLYTISNNKDILFFGSEHYIMSKFENKVNLDTLGEYELEQIKPNQAVCIDLEEFSIDKFHLNEVEHSSQVKKNGKERLINNIEIESDEEQLSTVMDLNEIHLNSKASQELKLLEYPIERIKKLKRCSNCLLPETFPYIKFDDSHVCNYCRNYKSKKRSSSIEELQKLVEPYRRAGVEPEVLIPISGGRDSTYVLHKVVKDLDLNAISYTYDWGMVTDLARRNIARICGKLGVENIIVAADIHWKRKNIKKNIQAWLKNPELGMIPLFMAGDKFFFYHAYKIKKELGIELEVWGVNDLENTNFKTGFAGLKPEFEKERIYSISLLNKLKLFGFVGRNLVMSPGYINQSLLDSLGSFGSRYFVPKDHYYHLFDYMSWDEKEIEDTLFEEYNWEKAVDTDSTWRIGDGTASFYNYIYTRVAGFSENDTFRSNQIREGMLSREDAMELIYEENKPRYNSLKWYLEIIGLDFESSIKQINRIPSIF